MSTNDELKVIYRVALQHRNLGLLADLYARCANGRLKPTDLSAELTLEELRAHAQQHRIVSVKGLLSTIHDLQNGRTTHGNIDRMVSDLKEVGVDPAQAGLDHATVQALRHRAYDDHAR